MSQENKMGVMPINKLLISMSLPMIISMLVQALYNIVDSVFVSMINQAALTAVSMILAIGRAMGETMAVMMVIGNANLFPSLLGKSESIAAVIALEMGTAVVGSTHYHALYAAGMVLMLLLFLINSGITLLRSKLEQ